MLMRGTLLGAFAVILTACVGDSTVIVDAGLDAGKPQGSEGGPCFPNGTCNTGLKCTLVNGTGVCTQDDAAASDVADTGDTGSSDACVPKGCTAQGFNCGTASDTCGGTLNCSQCPGGQYCVANVCCIPKTCTQQGLTCGQATDTCGNGLNCGNCTSPQTCTNNVCN